MALDGPHETALEPSSFATSAARMGAPISRKSRCASRSSRRRAVSSPFSRASSAIEPVKVLEQRHCRHAPTANLGDPLQQRVELALASVRIHPGGRLLGIGDAEKIEGQRKGLAETLIQKQ